jgi:hypothetical protein
VNGKFVADASQASYRNPQKLLYNRFQLLLVSLTRRQGEEKEAKAGDSHDKQTFNAINPSYIKINKVNKEKQFARFVESVALYVIHLKFYGLISNNFTSPGFGENTSAGIIFRRRRNASQELEIIRFITLLMAHSKVVYSDIGSHRSRLMHTYRLRSSLSY